MAAANIILYKKGHRFGKWSVVSEGKSTSVGKYWLCKCDCGTLREVAGIQLRNGGSTCCGCNNHIAAARANWKGVGELSKTFWGSIERGARNRNIPMEVTIGEAWELFLKQDRKCAITGVPLTIVKNQTKKQPNGTASLDRIDNTKGYVNGNIQWIHKDINAMKMAHSMEHFRYLCKLVVDNSA